MDTKEVLVQLEPLWTWQRDTRAFKIDECRNCDDDDVSYDGWAAENERLNYSFLQW